MNLTFGKVRITLFIEGSEADPSICPLWWELRAGRYPRSAFLLVRLMTRWAMPRYCHAETSQSVGWWVDVMTSIFSWDPTEAALFWRPVPFVAQKAIVLFQMGTVKFIHTLHCVSTQTVAPKWWLPVTCSITANIKALLYDVNSSCVYLWCGFIDLCL